MTKKKLKTYLLTEEQMRDLTSAYYVIENFLVTAHLSEHMFDELSRVKNDLWRIVASEEEECY